MGMYGGEECVHLTDSAWSDCPCNSLKKVLCNTIPTPNPSNQPTTSPTGCLGAYPRGPCNEGYMDSTNGNSNYWSCGASCAGGIYRTDGGCGCACIADSTCDPTADPTADPTTNPTPAPTE